jgi:hypothetical protein
VCSLMQHAHQLIHARCNPPVYICTPSGSSIQVVLRTATSAKKKQVVARLVTRFWTTMPLITLSTRFGRRASRLPRTLLVIFLKKAPATSRTSDLNTEGALGLVALASQPIKGCCIQVPFTLFIRGKHGKITLNKSLLPNGDLVLNDLI